MINYTQKDIERFYSRIHIINEGPNTGCWEIDYRRNKDGYTQFSIKGIQILSHRFMYQIQHQEENIEGLFVCHSCDNPWCINPDHLWLGTNIDNMKDMTNKNRQAKGSNNGNSKLTENNVEEMLINILNGYFRSTKEIINHYNIKSFMIHSILRSEYWTHVSDNFNMDDVRKKMNEHIKKAITHDGCDNPRANFNETEVRDIRKRLSLGEIQTQIASIYNVHPSIISKIKLGKSYKNVV